MIRQRGRRQSPLVEFIVVLAVAVVLTAAAKPMVTHYVAGIEKSEVWGDLKMFYASTEAYYTEKQDVPPKAGMVITHWAEKYSGKYSYTRYAPRHYEFITQKKIGGVYLYIDERGTVEERK